MEKFALSYEEIEVRARLRNELNSYVKVTLYHRKRLLRVVIAMHLAFAPCHWIEEKEATNLTAQV